MAALHCRIWITIKTKQQSPRQLTAKESEQRIHACTWQGDDTKEDIRIFGSSEQEPFTKLEFIEYLPSKIDFEHESKEDVDLYLSDVKDALIEADGIDPSILEVD